MDDIRDSARLDWLVELAGAAAPAAAAGFAGSMLAPAFAPAWALAAFAAAYLAMRMVRAEPRQFALPEFDLACLETMPAQDELLLDAFYCEDAAELLLDDRLAEPPADSRVVRLFAIDTMPTAGQLKDRIDRHLATGALQQVPDASDALFAALADLRRSLR